MKKKELLIFLVIIGIAIIFSIAMIYLNKKLSNNKSSKNDNVPDNMQSSAKLYYELEDRYIYLHGLNSISFTYNNETKELKEWFKKDKNFFSKFIEELELETGYNDGGTAIYLDGGTKSFNLSDIVVIVCKKIENDGYNNNIHIGKNLKYKNDVCHKKRKDTGLKD